MEKDFAHHSYISGWLATLLQAVPYTEDLFSVNNRQQLTGGQAVIETLRAHRVDTLFGIPGVHTLSIYDALSQVSDIRHILARHEQGAGFMAEGYARVTGRPGVVSTITGPGVTNVATPVANAYADSTPLLVISSSLPLRARKRGRGELHEVKHQLGVMEALTGWARAVEQVEEIPDVLHEAFQVLQSGRPRGAYVQIPMDLLDQVASMTIPEPEPTLPLAPEPMAIQQATALLKQAKRPFIVAGAGVTAAGANQQLIQLAEYLHAPVLLGSKSHDVLPTEHPLVLTTNDALPQALYDFTSSCDLVLVVGGKLGAERTANGQLPLPATLIHIDIDAGEIGHNYPASLGIVSDARLALEALFRNLQNGLDTPVSAISLSEIEQVRQALYEHTRSYHYEGFALLQGLQESLSALGQDTIIVADMTLLGYACAQFLPVYQPRTFIHPAEFCTIGCGLPLALGAKVAAPDRHVIALCGDGGFLLNASELATAVQERISVIAIIFNDSTFATVKKEQQRRFDGRYIATDLVAPDYLAIARGFHAHTMRASTPEELCTAIRLATHNDGPTVIEVPLPPKQW